MDFPHLDCKKCLEQFYLDEQKIPENYCNNCPLKRIDKNLLKDLYLYYYLKSDFIRASNLQEAIIQAIYPNPTADQFLFILEKLLVIDEMFRQFEREKLEYGKKANNSS